MLQSIRDRAKGWLISVLIILGIIAFTLWGIHSYLGANTNNLQSLPIIANVSGTSPITQTELSFATTRLYKQQKIRLGADFTIDPQIIAQLRKQALEQLILIRLLSKDALQAGYRISEAELMNTLLKIPAFQVNGQFTKERFYEVLDTIPYTKQDFLDDLRKTLLIQQLHIGFVQSAFASPTEVDTAIKLVNQTRDFMYAMISSTQFKSESLHAVSTKQAYDFYKNHTDQFIAPERVSIAYIKFSSADIARTLKFNTAQLHRFYQDNLANYIYQFHNKKRILPFAKIRKRVIKDLTQKQANLIFTRMSDKLSELTDASYSNSLNVAAKQLHLPIKTTHLFDRQGGTDEVTKDPTVVAAAFSKRVLSGKNSYTLSFSSNASIVLRINQHQPKGSYPFAQVRKRIVDYLAQQAAMQKTHRLGKQLIRQLIDDPRVANHSRLKWQSIVGVARYNHKIPASVLEAAFKMTLSPPRHAAITGFSLTNGNYVIVKLLAVHDGDVQKITPQLRSIYREALANSSGEFDYALYARDLLQKAKITLLLKNQA